MKFPTFSWILDQPLNLIPDFYDFSYPWEPCFRQYIQFYGQAKLLKINKKIDDNTISARK